jgi:hypothetical protein
MENQASSKGGGVPLDIWNGSRAIKELHATITEFNRQSETQTKRMIQLTLAILALTAVMLVGVAVQIYLAAKALFPDSL